MLCGEGCEFIAYGSYVSYCTRNVLKLRCMGGGGGVGGGTQGDRQKSACFGSAMQAHDSSRVPERERTESPRGWGLSQARPRTGGWYSRVFLFHCSVIPHK